jgi:hypothetical protein
LIGHACTVQLRGVADEDVGEGAGADAGTTVSSTTAKGWVLGPTTIDRACGRIDLAEGPCCDLAVGPGQGVLQTSMFDNAPGDASWEGSHHQ